MLSFLVFRVGSLIIFFVIYFGFIIFVFVLFTFWGDKSFVIWVTNPLKLILFRSLNVLLLTNCKILLIFESVKNFVTYQFLFGSKAFVNPFDNPFLSDQMNSQHHFVLDRISLTII